jgi:hypothetical protein
MLDTLTPVTQQIAKLISSGIAESELLIRVTQQFPDLSPTELSVALQAGMAAAERKVLQPVKGRALLEHWRAIKPRQAARRH